MPYLSIHTNLELDQEQRRELMRRASALVAEALKKPEAYVMVEACAGISMQFAGSDEPCAWLRLESLGLKPEQTPELSSLLCRFLAEHLSIAPERIYVVFSSPERCMWGWNGRTFG